MALQMSMATSSSTAPPLRWSSSRSMMISAPCSLSFSSPAAAATQFRKGSRRPVITCSSKSPSGGPGPSDRDSLQDSSEPSSVASTVPPPQPEQKPKPKPSLASLFAVNGAAPETINGRMAMVGFVWALAAERVTGLGVVDQLFQPSTSGLLWYGAVVTLFTVASIIPFANGEFAEARGWGPFNAKAERWNGRLAMLGFAALLLVEVVRQAPLFDV